MILPSSLLQAAQPVRKQTRRAPLVSDVELDADGNLRGVVVNVQGVPISKTPIVVRSGDRKMVKQAKTDALGCFSIDGLQGGVFVVGAGRYSVPVRTWAACTAPPKTKRMVLIVVGGDVVRGQRPLKDFLLSDPVLIAGLVAAMIAIPIAVNQSRRTPSTP